MDTKAFRKLTYGLYVISSKKENKINGQIANTVFQISSDPPTVAISINKNNLTHEFIQKSKIFTVSILSNATPLNLIGNFGFKSGRDTDKFASVNYKETTSGLPVLLDRTLGYLEAEVIDQIEVATHTVFIGKITNAELTSDDEPMTYAFYHMLKKGDVPPPEPLSDKEKKTASIIDKSKKTNTNINNDNNGKEDNKMQKYECTVCGYIYDPEEGDPTQGIEPGTPFADLPEDWVCPICGITKDEFEVVA